jgi:hypothetical protein
LSDEKCAREHSAKRIAEHASDYLAGSASRSLPELKLGAFAPPLPATQVFDPFHPGRCLRVGFVMPLYFFRIRNGRYSGASEVGSECADRDEAWKELTNVCADIAGGISRKLRENSEWHMEMLNEEKQPVFRISIVAETLD